MLEIEKLLKNFDNDGSKIINFFESQLAKLNTGRANPRLLAEIRINYYDVATPLEQLASLTNLGPLQIGVKPYDLSILKSIEKELINSHLPISVNSEEGLIRVNFPPITSERRKEMVKQLHGFNEQAKIALRQIRSKLNKEVKTNVSSEQEQKQYLQKIQKQLDSLVTKVEQISQKREEEILKV